MLELTSDYHASPDIETGEMPSAAATAASISNERTPLTLVAESTPLEKAAAALAVCSVATSIVAMIITQGTLVLIAGILSCLMGPWAYYQQTRLTDIRSLKETHEALEKEVDYLSNENHRLGKSIKGLTSTVGKLEDTEKALDAITETQGNSVKAFAMQVDENKEILDKMESNLRANVLQNVIDILIRSDNDGDFIIDDVEVDDLIARMERLQGGDMDDDKVRKIISDNNGDVNALMQIVKAVLEQDPKNGGGGLFIIKEEQHDSVRSIS